MFNFKKPSLSAILAIIPIGAVYLYVATIWFQFGYDSYFGIPANFISFSVRENTLFFRILVEGLLLTFKSIHWYVWILLVVIAGVSFFFSKFRLIVYALLILFAVLFLWRTVDLGTAVAKNQTSYFVLVDDCSAVGTTTKYFIPDFYDAKAILVPYVVNENHQNKMGDGFVTKDLTGLSCRVVYDYNFGKVEK